MAPVSHVSLEPLVAMAASQWVPEEGWMM